MLVAKNTCESLEGLVYHTTATGMLSFLGLLNVIRRLIPDFSLIASPLNEHLWKG